MTHPAIEAHKKSIAYAMAGEKAKWLALFDENAEVHDPVGPAPHDPEGKGFRGHAELAHFWDIMIAPQDIIIAPHRQIATGPDTAAVFMTMTNKFNGIKFHLDMIGIYVVNEAGKLVSLKAYWDTAEAAEKMK